jgi:hypothetical protein
MSKFYLKPAKKEHKENLPPKFWIEMEVNGFVINKMHKTEDEAMEIIDMFYEVYPDNGAAFIIKESKMNFQSLLKN